ncbi:MAG: hypothetical protein PHZ25_02800 [Candidatus Pacebacteria bacterium]|nr:hypothetical protein [Candidatus Paceibacterota bacterium]
MIKIILRFFDKLEDKIRQILSKSPLIYAFIGGVGIVLFWRGVWELADDLNLSSSGSLIISVIILLLTGTFVSFFIGEEILISGVKAEKRRDQSIIEKIEREQKKSIELLEEVNGIKKSLEEIKNKLEEKIIK